METLRPVRRTLLRDTAYEAIRDAIVRGDIPPGAPVRDADLAERLGLSRAPVREALSRLIGEGLVESKPQSYTRVTRLVPRDVRDAAAVVQAMQELAARGAVPHLTERDTAAMREANERFRAATEGVTSRPRCAPTTNCTTLSSPPAATARSPPPSSATPH